ncbi:hypothetical protein FRB96_005907 [Tulasnella sp. 330]|nr:hypothetical protein FRB96_005907 [Tulasnella sp. 330]
MAEDRQRWSLTQANVVLAAETDEIATETALHQGIEVIVTAESGTKIERGATEIRNGRGREIAQKTETENERGSAIVNVRRKAADEILVMTEKRTVTVAAGAEDMNVTARTETDVETEVTGNENERNAILATVDARGETTLPWKLIKPVEMEIDIPAKPASIANDDAHSSPPLATPVPDMVEPEPEPASSPQAEGTRSPPYDERLRERSRSRDVMMERPRPRSRGPPPFDDRRRYDDRDNYRGPPPPRRDAPPRFRRQSPSYDSREVPPPDDDAEARSVFVSQLAARLTARDLGYFFEDKLGEGTVRDSRIVQDRISRRSKGIAYVELASQELVLKAIALTGTVVMGLPIMVQLTESERNKQAATGDSLNLPPGVNAPPAGMQLYVGSLHFNLTESDIKQVFEPFGELDFVDLHKDPQTGRSKGYAFVQYKRGDDAKMALEQMDGFELAGRQLRVNTVHEKGSTRIVGGGSFGTGGIQQESLDEGGGTNLNNVSRQALMQKLARTEAPASRTVPIMRPTNLPETQKSKNLLLKNMFDPEEETERDWHTELEADVKEECEGKYGLVEAIKVEVESQGEIYVKFNAIESAGKALEGLNGRWFGGRQVSAAYISDALMQAHQ